MAKARAQIGQPDDDAGVDRLSEADFNRLSGLITQHTGIRLPAAKRMMVEGRLRKRIRNLGYARMADYCRYLFHDDGLATEFDHLIDAVTTNKTDFFREPEHFQLMETHIIQDILASRRASTNAMLKVWSAASSTGAEAYSLAMLLADMSPRMGNFRFSILGTDICTEVLAQASSAIYPRDQIAPVPEALQRRYVMSARNPSLRDEVRIVPELRKLTRFARMNLMDEAYPFDRDIDVIFLRNVLIYFDKPTQSSVLRRLISHLRPGGYLFLGHSESMIGTDLQMRQVAPAVFQHV